MIDTNLERSLPAAVDAERSILGAILLDNEAYFEASQALRPDDFSLESHRRLYARMMEISSCGRPIDLITITDELGKRKETESIGGVAYVSSLMDGLPRRPSIAQYVRIVKEKSLLREIIHANSRFTERALSQEDTPDILIAEHSLELLALQAEESSEEQRLIGQFTVQALDELKDNRERVGNIVGLSTGVEDLDIATSGGYRKKELTVIGARPGDGKTSMLAQAGHSAGKAGKPCVIFSLELSKIEMLHRLWSIESGINHDRIHTPKFLSREQHQTLKTVAMEMAAWPIHIIDTASLTAAQISSKARLLVRRHGVEMVLVDYAQIVGGERQDKDERSKMTRVAESMRELAKAEDVPVVLLSQLARPAGAKYNQKPTKFELKESGALEAAAYNVFLLYRPIDDDTRQPTGVDEIIVDKQRNGPTGPVPVTYDRNLLMYRGRTS